MNLRRPLGGLLFCALSAGALASMGCSGASADPIEDDSAEAVSRDSLGVSLVILESKLVFTTKLESFAIKDSGALNLPCRERSFNLTSKPTLYTGWSVDDAARFSEDVDGARYHSYELASCRDAQTQVLGWFGRDREYGLLPSDQLLDEDYDPRTLPMLLQRSSIGGAPTYYTCNSAFSKTLLSENDSWKRFDIRVACRKRNAPSKNELGPIDFITNPGPYASVASYNDWMLPAVASTPANFTRVRDALLSKVAAGAYNGAMSTLSKKCNLEIVKEGNKLLVNHTIVSSSRTRRIALEAKDLLGFVEGDMYKDPNRVSGAPQGTFAAAEFADDRGGSFVLRFEDNTSLDAKVVRINGSEAYCRRLAQ